MCPLDCIASVPQNYFLLIFILHSYPLLQNFKILFILEETFLFVGHFAH